jgi:hypothetical protein
MPQFQKYSPEFTNASARAASGFSTNARSEKTPCYTSSPTCR